MKFLIRNILREQTEDYRIVSANSVSYESIIKFLSNNFPNVDPSVLSEELFEVDWNTSLVSISNGNIVGLLLFSKESVCDYINSNTLLRIDPFPNMDKLCSSSGIKGVVYAIDPKFRGSSMNIDFMRYAKDIITKYDYVYALVYSFLRTHNYWKRMGMKNYATVLDDNEIVEIYLLQLK
jgi:hypothetical protein